MAYILYGYVIKVSFIFLCHGWRLVFLRDQVGDDRNRYIMILNYIGNCMHKEQDALILEEQDSTPT